jgi:hypothetical protein
MKEVCTLVFDLGLTSLKLEIHLLCVEWSQDDKQKSIRKYSADAQKNKIENLPTELTTVKGFVPNVQ